jgi:hypothetical protein
MNASDIWQRLTPAYDLLQTMEWKKGAAEQSQIIRTTCCVAVACTVPSHTANHSATLHTKTNGSENGVA